MLAALTKIAMNILHSKEFQKDVLKGAVKGVVKEIVKQQNVRR